MRGHGSTEWHAADPRAALYSVASDLTESKLDIPNSLTAIVVP